MHYRKRMFSTRPLSTVATVHSGQLPLSTPASVHSGFCPFRLLSTSASVHCGQFRLRLDSGQLRPWPFFWWSTSATVLPEFGQSRIGQRRIGQSRVRPSSHPISLQFPCAPQEKMMLDSILNEYIHRSHSELSSQLFFFEVCLHGRCVCLGNTVR